MSLDTKLKESLAVADVNHDAAAVRDLAKQLDQLCNRVEFIEEMSDAGPGFVEMLRAACDGMREAAEHLRHAAAS